MADAPKIILTGPDKDTLFSGAEKINQAIDNANEAKTAVKDVGTAITNANDAATRANSASDTAEARMAELNGVDAVQFKDRQDTFDAQLADVVKFPTEIYTPLKTVEETKQTFNATTLKAAITAGTVNAVFWGDSITEYSDAINPNDIYPMYFHSELKKSFPGVTFNYYNRAIRATNVYDANNSAYVPVVDSVRPWTVGNTKVWREVVRDLQPDVLFLAFGMNATTISATITNLEGILSYIATWTKVPTVVMITTPSPSKDFYTQSSIDTRIQCSRIHAYEGLINNFYIMDIGKKYRSLVDGVDENALYSKGALLSDFVNENPTYININGTVVRFTGAKRYLTSNEKFYNFYLECDVDFETAGLFRVEFRNDRNVLHIGNNRFTLYTKEGGTTLFTKPYTTNAGYNKVKIEVKENMIYITINGTTWEYNKMVYGTLDNYLYLTAADSNAVTFNNLKLSKYEYPTHKPMVEDMEVLWGAYDGTTNLKLPYGGNGANHPSSIGNLMIYYDAIHPFIKAVKEQL